MKKKNLTKFEIICYVVAALLAVTSIYMLIENIAYMNEYVAAYGMTFADLGSQALQSIVAAFVPYFTYAFLVLAAGMIYHAVAAPKNECECECTCEEAAEEAKAEEVVEVVLAETPAAVVVEDAE